LVYLQAIKAFSISSISQYHQLWTNETRLDELLEGTVDRRADVRDALPEINSGNSTLADSFRGKLELL
jgi:hypothetical protein